VGGGKRKEKRKRKGMSGGSRLEGEIANENEEYWEGEVERVPPGES